MRSLHTLIALLLVGQISAQDQRTTRIALDPWANGLNGPVGLANAGDERIFVVERTGVIKVISDSMTVAPTPLLDIRSRVRSSGGEQGLLALAFPPDHASSRVFYVHYTSMPNGDTRLSRFRLNDGQTNVADPNSEQIIFTWPQPATNHNGGDLHFDSAGLLYLSLGDGGSGNDPWNNGQDLTSPLGTLLRFDVSDQTVAYTVPPSNPFANAGGDTLGLIWAWGLRNPWRFSIDHVDGNVWIGDVGQNRWEEVDRWPIADNSGPNFGWRCREGFVATPGVDQTGCGTAAAYVSPIAAFPTGLEQWCSVIGGFVYRGTRWPGLQGRYIFTDYCMGDFLTIEPDGSVDTVLLTTNRSYTAFTTDGTGELYVANQGGTVWKIRDACNVPTPEISMNSGILSAPEGQAYIWFLDGDPIPTANARTWTPTANGSYTVQVTFGADCVRMSAAFLLANVGVSDPESKAGVRIYPQPASQLLYVERTPGSTNELLHLELVDAAGRTVSTGILPAGTLRTELRVAGQAAGTHVLRIIATEHGKAAALPILITP